MMIVIEPKMIYKGTYQYCRRNNFSAVTYLYDLNHTIYRLGRTYELSEVGILHPESQLKYGAVSFHPTEKRAVVILGDKSIAVCDFDGNLLHKQAGAYENAIYSRDGRLIWAVEKLDEEHLRISVLDSFCTLLASLEMEDELYDSCLCLSDIPKSDKIILELSAGQDGNFLYECDYTDSIFIKRLILSQASPNSSFIMPAWSPDGSKLFTLENDMQTYASFTYDPIEMISEQTEDFEDEDQIPGYNMIYLDNGLLIVQNANYRHFLFDPIKMEHLAEIVIQGMEPVPAHQIYKNLKEDHTLCSRIVYFDRIGENVLAARTNERSDEPMIIFVDEVSNG